MRSSVYFTRRLPYYQGSTSLGEEREGTMRVGSETVWRTEAPPDRVWEILADYERWPTWWTAIRSVELLDPGDRRGVGSRLRQSWRGRIPVPIAFDLAMERIERPHVLQGRASGALEGTCGWELVADGPGTGIRFVVDARMTRWWMRLPLPFASRVAAGEFRAVMEAGRQGLERHLGDPVTRLAPHEDGGRRLPAAAADHRQAG